MNRLAARRPCAAALLVLTFALLPLTACQAPMDRAKADAAERWNTARSRVSARLAADQLKSGQVEAAARQVEQAVKLDPQNPELRLLDARVCLAEGRAEQAETLLKDIPSDSPSRAHADYLLGAIYQQRRQLAKALVHYQRASQASPDQVAFLVAHVQTLQQLRRTREARDLLAAREAAHGHTGAFQAALAESLELSGEWDAAAQAWRRFLATDEQDVAAREHLALALRQAGKLAEATSELQRVVEQDPQACSEAAIAALVEMRLDADGLPEAQRLVGQLLQRDAQSCIARRLMAELLAREGDFAKALTHARAAVGCAPQALPVLELAAGIALRAGDLAFVEELVKRIEQSDDQESAQLAAEFRAQLGG